MKAPKEVIDDLKLLAATFKQAKLLGSIMHFDKQFDFDKLVSAVNLCQSPHNWIYLGFNQLKIVFTISQRSPPNPAD